MDNSIDKIWIFLLYLHSCSHGQGLKLPSVRFDWTTPSDKNKNLHPYLKVQNIPQNISLQGKKCFLSICYNWLLVLNQKKGNKYIFHAQKYEICLENAWKLFKIWHENYGFFLMFPQISPKGHSSSYWHVFFY